MEPVPTHWGQVRAIRTTLPQLRSPLMAAYTVGLPGGTRDFEYEAYVRLLEQNGVNVAQTCRVVDPVGGKRWLHAWANEADAEVFAVSLRQETENPAWKVYTLPDAEPNAGPLGPIDVLVVR